MTEIEKLQKELEELVSTMVNDTVDDEDIEKTEARIAEINLEIEELQNDDKDDEADDDKDDEVITMTAEELNKKLSSAEAKGKRKAKRKYNQQQKSKSNAADNSDSEDKEDNSAETDARQLEIDKKLLQADIAYILANKGYKPKFAKLVINEINIDDVEDDNLEDVIDEILEEYDLIKSETPTPPVIKGNGRFKKPSKPKDKDEEIMKAARDRLSKI